MMRSRTPSSPKEEEDHPEPKRPKRDVAYDEGRETVKIPMPEHLQALLQLVDDCRAQLVQAEAEARKAELQLLRARKRLTDAESQLASAKSCLSPSGTHSSDSLTKVKIEQNRDIPIKEKIDRNSSLIVPGSNGSSSLSVKGGSAKKIPEPRTSPVAPRTEPSSKMKVVKSESGSLMEKRPVRKRPEPRETVNLVPSIRRSSAPEALRVLQTSYVMSQHKRKLRSLAINPTSEQICATSALDGIISLWQIHGSGNDLYPLSSVDCLSPKQRRWPEDMVWHPNGNCLIACYSADGQDSQVAVIDSSAKVKTKFLDDKPHIKGIINSVAFLPWGNDVFVTGGSDHAVCLWEEKEINEGLKWKARALHRSQHSSAVMGVAGLQQKELVISAGADKRVVAHDIRYNRSDARYTLESKAMGVLPNPADFNLFMVQTGTPGQQLRLFDIRVQRTELHTFGWKQEISDSQSALIDQTWSPNGYYIASGSTDPKIHIFDIRYNSKEPSQSIKAHQKRVFKAAWHHTLPLLISISSDLNIGLHRYFA